MWVLCFVLPTMVAGRAYLESSKVCAWSCLVLTLLSHQEVQAGAIEDTMPLRQQQKRLLDTHQWNETTQVAPHSLEIRLSYKIDHKSRPGLVCYRQLGLLHVFEKMSVSSVSSQISRTENKLYLFVLISKILK